MKHYRILSLKYSPNAGGNCVWWGRDYRGYSQSLETAGIYSQEEIDANPSYLNNGETTRAVEVDEALAKSHTAVSWPIS